MQSPLIAYAKSIRTAAMQIEAETKPKDPKDSKLSQELQAYATFLRKFLTTKGNEDILSKITPLIDNPRVRKPRNTVLMMLEKGEQKRAIGDVAQLIIDIRRVLMRYGQATDRFPSVRLLKEILNFGVVNGVPAFKRLLSVQRRLYNTFNAQEEKKKEQEVTTDSQSGAEK